MMLVITRKKTQGNKSAFTNSVEPHHFYAAPAPPLGNNFETAQVPPAPAPKAPIAPASIL
jgi:hypothetical protein